MEDFILDNIQSIMIAACSFVTVGIVTWKKKHQYKVQTVFKTTQFKTRFKKHQINFNEQFKGGNNFIK